MQPPIDVRDLTEKKKGNCREGEKVVFDTTNNKAQVEHVHA
jgi:hypothetical protein